jgi:AAA domain
LGKLTVLEGDPGLGKSTIALDLAARVSGGAPMPDGAPGVEGGVVLLTAEDGLGDTVRPRLEAAGADCARVVALTGVRLEDQDFERPAVLPNDLRALEQAIAEVHARLVIVDPLAAFLGSNIDSWRDQDVRRALHPLAQLAERFGVAVLVIRHWTKAQGRAVYRGGGSIGITAAARSVLLVARDPDDPDENGRRILAPVKCNLSAPPSSLAYRLEAAEAVARIAWAGTSQHRADTLATGPDDVERSAADDAKAFLLDALAGGPVAVRDLQAAAKEAGISWITVRRAKDALGVTAKKRGLKEGWEWAPAEDVHSVHIPRLNTLGGSEHLQPGTSTYVVEPDGPEAKMLTPGNGAPSGIAPLVEALDPKPLNAGAARLLQGVGDPGAFDSHDRRPDASTEVPVRGAGPGLELDVTPPEPEAEGDAGDDDQLHDEEPRDP